MNISISCYHYITSRNVNLLAIVDNHTFSRFDNIAFSLFYMFMLSNATFRWNCHIGQEPAVRDSIFAYAIEKMNIPFSTFQFRPYLLFHIIQFHYHNTFLQFSVKQL